MAYLSYFNALGACEGQSELGVVLYFALEVSFAEIRDGHQEAKNTTTYLGFSSAACTFMFKTERIVAGTRAYAV